MWLERLLRTVFKPLLELLQNFLGLLIFWPFVSAASVTLTWDPNSEPDLAGYRMYRSEQAGTGYEQISQDFITSIVYIDGTLEPGIPYYYVCTAVNEAGLESGYSNEVAYRYICRGDANADSQRTVSDAVAISRHIVGLDILAGYPLLAADANGDGAVTVSDVVAIQRHIVGLSALPECK